MGYTILEAAKLLGLSPKTIRKQIRDGKLKAIQKPSTFGNRWEISELPGGTPQTTARQVVDLPEPEDNRHAWELVRDLHAEVVRLTQENAELKAKLSQEQPSKPKPKPKPKVAKAEPQAVKMPSKFHPRYKPEIISLVLNARAQGHTWRAIGQSLEDKFRVRPDERTIQRWWGKAKQKEGEK